LLDANLLLLLFVGKFRREQIGTFKRLNTFTVEDFDTLLRMLGWFKNLLTTPNILTEVSNLSNSLPSNLKASYFAEFARNLELLKEEYVPSPQAVARNEFVPFGLTDAAIARLAETRCLIVTVDFPLSQYLTSLGLDAFNFNQIRRPNWKPPW
jgi:hypothetical protein